MRDLALGNGLTTSRRYWGIDWIPDASNPADRYGRLSSAVTPAPGGGVLQSLAYGYDDGGNVRLLQDARANEQVADGDDELDRLTGAASTVWTAGQPSAAPWAESYGDDQVGTMLSHDGQA